MPLVSVIIPAFNSEKTIRETIDSVLHQTLSNVEIIVINDGSQDSTLEVAASISDVRLKIFSYNNAGVSASRNRGLIHASGDYIAFLDADDLWTLDKLQTQLEALQSHPKAVVAYSWTDWIDESGQFLRHGGHITENGDVHKQLLLRDFIESGSNPLILKQALIEVGGFNETLSAAADWDMWLRLAARYEFVAVPSAQVLYRVSSQSMSANVWKMEAESKQVIERAFTQVPDSLSLKRQVLAQRYQYLTLKALEGSLDRYRGITAARFFKEAVRNNPKWLGRIRLMVVILGKIAIAILLPAHSAQGMLKAIKQWVRKSRGLSEPQQVK
ncbi:MULTISPECIES: glycosyltransferase [Trichocoleus]|uniref:Glycosyltransferase n=1 Tax=Trichocoleus desertorum GB2-A4 TaxID=2933944 RepID=A0ABV0J6S6_9CYAN|nr:glycosyltransferase [Trichocoleus sp. FACHB-46]MBD1863681.1 glycosyltransferase [Trichocoleus sp. FACHB-46]